MDIFKVVNYEESFEYTLKDPSTGEDTDVVIYLRSSANADAKIIDLKYLNSVKSSNLTKKPIPVEKDLDYAYEKLASCITGWNENMKSNGEKLEFNSDNVDKIVRIDWINNQLSKQVDNIENFTK